VERREAKEIYLLKLSLESALVRLGTLKYKYQGRNLLGERPVRGNEDNTGKNWKATNCDVGWL
jgi:hypothetical protein